ncbi:MAG: ROK family protein [Candidatus Doudnabacteria bacterium]|jgi:glucokinase
MHKVIGLDIGGTKISGILFNGKKVVKELTIKTPDNLLEFERNLLKLADFLSVGEKVTSLGVGMAGLIDSKQGVVRHSPNIKFIKNFPLTKLFLMNGFKKVQIENDARCFAQAVNLVGEGKKFKNIVCITLGTGIGGGFIFNGQSYHGANLGAGEVGHMIYSGTGTFEEVFQKARDKNDDQAMVKIIGALLTNIYRLVDPELVVLGGGVATDKKRNFVNKAKIFCAKNLASYKIKPSNIVVSKLKNAGAIGAALLVK